jgi:hypothetical protein
MNAVVTAGEGLDCRFTRAQLCCESNNLNVVCAAINICNWVTQDRLRSREIAINFLSIQAPDKGYHPVLEDKPKSVIPDTNPVVFSFGLEPFEVRNVLEGSGGFDLFEDFFDAAPKGGVVDA